MLPEGPIDQQAIVLRFNPSEVEPAKRVNAKLAADLVGLRSDSGHVALIFLAEFGALRQIGNTAAVVLFVLIDVDKLLVQRFYLTEVKGLCGINFMAERGLIPVDLGRLLAWMGCWRTVGQVRCARLSHGVSHCLRIGSRLLTCA